MARKALSKKLRFEVFKRDSFTCQYCGKGAPEVILHADHIKPVADGGKNTITNLLTACASCNLGKGAVALDDNAVAAKQMRQLKELNERREQIRMIADWHSELVNLEADQLGVVAGRIAAVAQCGLSPHGEKLIKSALKKYGLSAVLSALEKSSDTYLKGEFDPETQSKFISMIPRICYWTDEENKCPDGSGPGLALACSMGMKRGFAQYRKQLWDLLVDAHYGAAIPVHTLSRAVSDSRSMWHFKRKLAELGFSDG